jgi:hypothetical protein
MEFGAGTRHNDANLHRSPRKGNSGSVTHRLMNVDSSGSSRGAQRVLEKQPCMFVAEGVGGEM